VSYIIKNPGIVWDLLLEHLQMTSSGAAGCRVGCPAVVPADYPLPLAGVPVMGTLGTLYTAEPGVDYSGGASVRPQLKFSGCSNSDLCSGDFGAQHHSGAAIDQARDSGSGTRHGHESLATLVACAGAANLTLFFLAGLRLAAIVGIATATIRAKFGAGGLGVLLFDGISQAGRYDKIWAGAIECGNPCLCD